MALRVRSLHRGMPGVCTLGMYETRYQARGSWRDERQTSFTKWAAATAMFATVLTGVGMTLAAPAQAVGGYSIRSGQSSVRSSPTTGSGLHGVAGAQQVPDLICQYWDAQDGAQSVSVSGYGTSATTKRTRMVGARRTWPIQASPAYAQRGMREREQSWGVRVMH